MGRLRKQVDVFQSHVGAIEHQLETTIADRGNMLQRIEQADTENEAKTIHIRELNENIKGMQEQVTGQASMLKDYEEDLRKSEEELLDQKRELAARLLSPRPSYPILLHAHRCLVALSSVLYSTRFSITRSCMIVDL